MKDDLQQTSEERSGERRGLLFYVGAAGLLAAMTVDALAVLGRHVGMPLRGSIELVQACILLTASAAMLSATLMEGHAVVHLLTARLRPRAQAALVRLSNLLSALFFAAVAVGAVWLIADLWTGHEESELLHIPFKPLRLVSAAAVAAIALVFLVRAVRPGGAR